MANPKTAASIARLRRRLAKVPLEVRAAAAAEALLQARALGQAMQRVVAVDEGDLRASVRIEPGKYGDRFYVKAGGPKTTKRVRNSGKGNAPEYDYALAVEFGTKKMRARPFFYPTYRTNRRAMKRAIENVARKAAARFNQDGG